MQSPYVDIAIKAVKAAETVILQHYKSDVQVITKADLTPVTIADRQAEDIIRRTILEAFPDHTFFGEEGEKVDLDNHSGFSWIIDPIDGTKSFIRGIPIFGTQLALMHNSELIVGVSNAPVWGELVYAAKGEGAFIGARRLQVSTTSQLADAYISNGRLKYFEALGKMPQLLHLSQSAQWARGIGDFWAYQLVAEGKIDVMLEGSVKLWDIAAAKVIVEEAGGTMTQLDGAAISYTSTSAVASNGILHDAIISALN